MTRLIGAHVSCAGGIHCGIERAAAIDCSCAQIFSGSPRVWQKPSLDQVDPENIWEYCHRLGIEAIFTHALYLVNLASDKPELVEKSVKSLQYELAFDARIRGSGVIVHLGSHQGRGFEQMKDQLIDRLVHILDTTPDNSLLLIENAAGQNGKIGGKFEEIVWLLEELERAGAYVSRKQVGWCLDTCHAFAAGYRLADIPRLVVHHKLVDSLACIHVNDSRDPFASGRDRHENLGDGQLPQDDLKQLLNHPSLAHLPLILEVPGIEREGPDAENVRRLRALVG